MIQAKCIQKFRDNQNKIYGYRLQDINGQTQDVTSENLKRAIANKQIAVVNLTLTSDNRLVDRKEETLQSDRLGEAPKNYKSNEDKFFEILYDIEKAFCKYVEGGDPGCDLDYNGASYTDMILGVYYPDEYKGDANDYDHCYGVTVNIDCEEPSIWIAWQGDNGMATEEFTEEAKLTLPLFSSKNIEIIKKAFESFGKRVKRWIYNDENGIEQVDFNHLAGINIQELRSKFKDAIMSGKYPRKDKYTKSDLIAFAKQIGMIK